jgi:predicted nucleic acid-binding protein
MQVLVDTSVWVGHLRKGDDLLVQLLENGKVICHPFVITELACGNLKNRSTILNTLGELEKAPTMMITKIFKIIPIA